ncbi:MAG: nucleotidyltransferase family protein [Candidatus Dormibacteraceae bacterium]
MILLLGDLDLHLRGRTHREPAVPHVAVAWGRDLARAVDHAAARADCMGVAVIGPRAGAAAPELSALAGRRLLVVDSDRARMAAFAEAGLEAGAEVESILHPDLPLDRVAAWALPVAAVVLAAGSSSRMGTNKLLLDLDGRPLVAHVLEAARKGGCHPIVGVWSDPAVGTALEGGQGGEGGATLVHNPEAASGIASSLRSGLAALPPWVAGAMVLLGDQPLVGSATVASLLQRWRAGDARPAAATAHAGRWVPPILIDRSLWPELAGLTGDEGARQVLGARPELVDVVAGSGSPDDVDTPDDYARVVRLSSRRNRA